jgi:hypothetical protein
VTSAAERSIARYASLYRSSISSKGIAKEYLEWTLEPLPPLSVSHGIDLDHEAHPQDSLNAEPIHWCYSEEMHARAARLKPSLLLAHPWLLLDELSGRRRPPSDGRMLLVGPPASATNDERLAEALSRTGIAPDAILVKERDGAQTERAKAFWARNGIVSVSAGGLDGEHVRQLYEIITSFEHVALPVFSSVGILAAAVGAKIRLVRPYQQCSYSPRALDLSSLARSPKARAVLRAFSGAAGEATQTCRSILGEPLLGSPIEKRAELERLIRGLKHPVFVASARGGGVRARLMSELALTVGRADFLKAGLSKSLYYKMFGTDDEIVWKRIDMFDAIENGLSRRNYASRPLLASERGARSGRGAEEPRERRPSALEERHLR